MAETPAPNQSTIAAEGKAAPKKKPFYMTLWGQVLIGVALAVVYGYLRPESAAKMKPLGDGFIKLITMVITVIIFCTVVSGIAGMENLKKVGRIGERRSCILKLCPLWRCLRGCWWGIYRIRVPGST